MIAVVAAGLATPFVLMSVREAFGDQLFTDLMPAPQSRLVASAIVGFPYPWVFLGGFVVALVAEILNAQLPRRYRSPVLNMPLGIGLFLGLGLALPIMIGAIVRAWIDRDRPDLRHPGVLVAAGVMGGEGIAGFGVGALTTTGLSSGVSALVMGVGLLLIFVAAIRRRIG